MEGWMVFFSKGTSLMSYTFFDALNITNKMPTNKILTVRYLKTLYVHDTSKLSTPLFDITKILNYSNYN